MMLTLSAKKKIGFVDGSIVKPDSSTSERKAWERCNDLVSSWVIFNLDDVIAKSVLFLKTTKEIWNDLNDRFGYTSMTQVYSLEQQLADLKQRNDSISEFFTKIKTLWDSMFDVNPLPQCNCNKCTCDLGQRVSQMQHDQRMLHFMKKLNDEFSVIRGPIAGNYKRGVQNNSQKKPGAQYFCSYCQIPGHSLERCFKVHGYPPDFKTKDRKVAAISH